MNLSGNIIVQGIDDPQAQIAVMAMQAASVKIVAGIAAGRGGETIVQLPVFDLVAEASLAWGEIAATLIFVPPYQVLDAGLEAIAAGIPMAIVVTPEVPPLDAIALLRQAELAGMVCLGTGSAGILLPGRLLLGTLAGEFFQSGTIAILSRSVSLAYEVSLHLAKAGYGESIVIHLGSDAIVGSACRQWLEYCHNDPLTEAVVVVGDIYWEDERNYLPTGSDLPVVTLRERPIVAYLPGESVPTAPRLADMASIVNRRLAQPIDDGATVRHRIAAFKQAKIPVARKISQIPSILTQLLKKV
jgi:succinyl-CoA synthetase alpha subunit